MNKKRKLDLGGNDDESKMKLISHFKQLTGGSDVDITVTNCKSWVSVVVGGIPKGLSTEKIRKQAEGSGLCLIDCEIEFGVKSKMEFKLGQLSEDCKLQFAGGPKKEYLHRGATEDDLRIDAIKEYALNYMGKSSPPAECITVTVCLPGGKPWKRGTDPVPKTFEVQIEGWTVCNLAMLETFQQMFPCHVGSVQIDNKKVQVPLQSHLHPFYRMFTFS